MNSILPSFCTDKLRISSKLIALVSPFNLNKEIILNGKCSAKDNIKLRSSDSISRCLVMLITD